jgi:hypothetical protein
LRPKPMSRKLGFSVSRFPGIISKGLAVNEPLFAEWHLQTINATENTIHHESVPYSFHCRGSFSGTAMKIYSSLKVGCIPKEVGRKSQRNKGLKVRKMQLRTSPLTRWYRQRTIHQTSIHENATDEWIFCREARMEVSLMLIAI